MWYVAFTLGLFGSLHCVGMCGPLALTFCPPQKNKTSQFFTALFYNLGRTVTYGVLGFIFGMAGTFILVSGFQKTLSIVLGVLLILSFFLSVDVESELGKFALIKPWYEFVQKILGFFVRISHRTPPFLLGMANGLLPCGLVYLAISGALAAGGLVNAVTFMIAFGLGTLPLMFILIFGSNHFGKKLRQALSKFLPYLSLVIGLYLIWRGWVVSFPEELNFWEALKNPVMCH